MSDVSLRLAKGGVFGFLGPNGAGKTTTTRMLTTLVPPLRGEARVLGYDVQKQGLELGARIGVVLEGESYEFSKTVEEVLRLHGMVWDIPRRAREERIEELLCAAIGVVVVILGATIFSGLSITIASPFKSLEAFEGKFNFLLILLTFVNSLLYPLTSVPSALRYLMLLNPLTYDADIVRAGLLGLQSQYLAWEGLALGAEAIAMFMIGLVANRSVRVGTT